LNDHETSQILSSERYGASPCRIAVEYGQLAALIWLKSIECPWNRFPCMAAAKIVVKAFNDREKMAARGTQLLVMVGIE